MTVSVLLYTTLSTSLLAAFLAMLGKQWLNRYARHQGGSATERCEDRQRKLDGLQRLGSSSKAYPSLCSFLSFYLEPHYHASSGR